MIHPTAIVSPDAKIGQNVTIGAFTIVNNNVVIGSNSNIGSHCELGVYTPLANNENLYIGESSIIRSHSVFYMGSVFGENLTTGHRVTVREKTKAGKNLQIGTLSDIQGNCEIGDFVRFHSNVHIGKHSKIGNYVWIFPYVVLTNDPHPPSEVMLGVTVEDYVAIATMSIILPGSLLKSGALIAAHSSVSRTVEPDTVVGGSPAKFICNTDQIKMKNGSNLSAYPWRKHFHRGYPDEVVALWLNEFPK